MRFVFSGASPGGFLPWFWPLFCLGQDVPGSRFLVLAGELRHLERGKSGSPARILGVKGGPKGSGQCFDSVEVIPLRDFQQGIIPSVYAIIYRLYSQSFFLLYRFFATNGIFRTWEAY
jgi:hypothetical protein